MIHFEKRVPGIQFGDVSQIKKPRIELCLYLKCVLLNLVTAF